MDKPEENMVNAGIIFMFTVWIQGQMADLVIFKNNPDFISDFIKNPTIIPKKFLQVRVSYWEKEFGKVKNEFMDVFSNILTDDEKKDAEEIYHLRNIIAHAHVSVGRDYMLYRPNSQLREQRLIDDLRLQSIDGQSDPMIIKIELWREDKFQNASKLLERFEQVTLKKIADNINVPHSRIR